MGDMRILRLLQRDDTGCGLAAVAMVTGSTYGEVKRQAIKRGLVKEGGSFITPPRVLRKLLGGRAGRARRAKHWDRLPDLAILGINYRPDENEWHWVVFVRTARDAYVLDPWPRTKTNRRRDWGRMRLRSSIPIRGRRK